MYLRLILASMIVVLCGCDNETAQNAQATADLALALAAQPSTTTTTPYARVTNTTDTTTFASTTVKNAGSKITSIAAQSVYTLAAGDTIKLRVYQSSGGNLSLRSAPTSPILSLIRLSD